MIEIPWNPTRKDLRIFTALLAVFALIVAGMIGKRTGNQTLAVSVAIVIWTLCIVGTLIPSVMRAVYVSWMVVVFPIGWAVSHVLLAAIFFLVVTPCGLLMRLSGRDPMQRRWERSAKTYWNDRPKTSAIDRYFKQF